MATREINYYIDDEIDEYLHKIVAEAIVRELGDGWRAAKNYPRPGWTGEPFITVTKDGDGDEEPLYAELDITVAVEVKLSDDEDKQTLTVSAGQFQTA